MGTALADYRKRLKRGVAWLLTLASVGPFTIYLLLTLLASLLDDE